MEQLQKREQALLRCLACIPKKMIGVHGIDNIPEFVLHELCNEHCFNLGKAAYFVDNPDFDHLKGVAGFSSQEAYADHDTMWDDPATFTLYMRSCPFNQTVRSCCRKSIRRNGDAISSVVQTLATDLGFDNPQSVEWDMKHDNHGILIYEGGIQNLKAHLNNSLYLLSFCPVF